MTKTMSIRMDRENFEFLNELTKEQRSDLSKAVRDMVTRGRVLFAMERYKKGDASLGRAAELAGVPVGQMMTLPTEFGTQSRIEDEDYLQGLAAIRKAWRRQQQGSPFASEPVYRSHVARSTGPILSEGQPCCELFERDYRSSADARCRAL